MGSNYKCDFCGAPRNRSDNSCKFCGQIFEQNINIKLKNIKYIFTNKKNQFENIRSSIDITFLKNIQDNLISGFIDSYKRSSKLIKETEKKGRELISNNSKKIVLTFIVLVFSLTTIQLLSNYLNHIADERKLKIDIRIATENLNKKNQYNALAEEKFKKNELEDAFNKYYESLKIPSDNKGNLYFRKANIKARKGIADIRILQRNYYSAIQQYSVIIDEVNKTKEILVNHSELFEIYYKRGLAYHASSKYISAKNDLSEALSLLKNHPIPERSNDFLENIYFLKGDSYLKIGNYKNAIKNINAAIAKDKNKPEYLQIKSRANYFLGKYDQSISDATKSLGLIKKDDKAKSYSFFIRAESNKSNKNYTNACFDLEKAFELNKLRQSSTIKSKFYKFNCLDPETKDYYLSKKISLQSPCEIKKIRNKKVSVGGESVNSSFIGCWRDQPYDKSLFDFGPDRTSFTHIFLNNKTGELGFVYKTNHPKVENSNYLIPIDISIEKKCEDCFSKTIVVTYYNDSNDSKIIHKYSHQNARWRNKGNKNYLYNDWQGYYTNFHGYNKGKQPSRFYLERY